MKKTVPYTQASQQIAAAFPKEGGEQGTKRLATQRRIATHLYEFVAYLLIPPTSNFQKKPMQYSCDTTEKLLR